MPISYDITGTLGDDTITGHDLFTDNIHGLDGNDILRGLSGEDMIEGGAGNDTLVGGAGADALYGGDGSDTASYDGSLEAVIVDMTTGTVSGGDAQGDGLFSIENVVGTEYADSFGGDVHDNRFEGGDGNDVLSGRGGTDDLQGGDGDDTIDGGLDVDTLDGGAGNDTMFGGEGYDVLKGAGGADRLDGGEGYDEADYTGSAAGVVVSLADGTGSGGDAEGDVLVNIEGLLGSVFADMLSGDGANNTLVGADGDDVLSGLGGIDLLEGGSGNDRLDGGADADTLYGDVGNDVYVVDNVGDVLEENLIGTDGIDLVESTISFSLADTVHVRGNVENLTLLGNADINGTGNGLANVIIGNAGANVLDGKAGADTLRGMAGNDSYVVDTLDVVDETDAGAGGGDTVLADFSFSLSDTAHVKGQVENLTLTGTADIDGTGNELANVLTGNAGVNVLRGLGGNDTYVFGNAGDVVDESAAGSGGIDGVLSEISFSLSEAVRVKGQVENLTLTGTANIDGTGNELANVLTGNAGANRLSGLAGNDTLTGGAGADSFVFDTALNKTTNIDTVAGFSSLDDTIVLDNAVFTRLKDGVLKSKAFFEGKKAHDGNDRIIYNEKNGALIYDSNGDNKGGKIQFAVLDKGLDLSAADFLVI